jgi:hypothetical protein
MVESTRKRTLARACGSQAVKWYDAARRLAAILVADAASCSRLVVAHEEDTLGWLKASPGERGRERGGGCRSGAFDSDRSQLDAIGYFAKISSIRLNAFSAAACGATPPMAISAQPVGKTCSFWTWA